MSGCVPRSHGRSIVVANFRSDPVILKFVREDDTGELVQPGSCLVSRYFMTSDHLAIIDGKSGAVLLKVEPADLAKYSKNNNVVLLEVK